MAKIRVIQALREQRPGKWVYRAVLGDWYSEDRQEYCVRVHIGGYDVSGFPMPGTGYYVYKVGTHEHLGEISLYVSDHRRN